VVLILRNSRFGIRCTGKPAGVHPLDVVGEGFGFLLLGAGIRLGVLLGQGSVIKIVNLCFYVVTPRTERTVLCHG
jgi:hypothetical protein